MKMEDPLAYWAETTRPEMLALAAQLTQAWAILNKDREYITSDTKPWEVLTPEEAVWRTFKSFAERLHGK